MSVAATAGGAPASAPATKGTVPVVGFDHKEIADLWRNGGKRHVRAVLVRELEAALAEQRPAYDAETGTFRPARNLLAEAVRLGQCLERAQNADHFLEMCGKVTI